MSRFNLRTLLFILLAGTSGYVFFFVLALINYPEESLLPLFKVGWVFEEALRSLIEHLPTLTFTAVLLSFGTINRGTLRHPPSTGTLSKPIRKTIGILIFFSLVYTALYVGMLPVLFQHRYNRLYSSTLAKNYLRSAEQAEKAGDLDLASRNYRLYLGIDGENRLIRGKLKELEGELSIEESESEKPEASAAVYIPHSEYRNLGVMQLLEKAQQALEEEDPFTAHYLAGIALEMEENREDARRISAEAWQRISSLEPTREEEERYKIYHRKLAAYQALTKHRPVEAYYIFRELRNLSRTDPDIREYLAESQKQAMQVAYFIDDAEASASIPGVPRIVFLNREETEVNTMNASGTPSNTQTLVYFDKLVSHNGDHWAHGIEILEFSREGEVLSHFYARYGRIIDHDLLLKGINRDNSEIVLEPDFYPVDGKADSAGRMDGDMMIYRLAPKVSQLSRLTRGQDFSRRLNLPALLEILPEIERFGYPKVEFELLVLMRLLKPFLFFILSVLGIGIGWHLRVHGEKFPLYLVPLVFPIPFAVHQLVLLFEYAHRLILSWSVLFGGMALGLAVLLITETILLFLALLGISIHREL
jgi:hypothetical protein